MRLRLLPIITIFFGFLCSVQPASADPILLSLGRSASASVNALAPGSIQNEVDVNADVLVASASASQGASAGSAQSTFASQLRPDNRQFSGSSLTTAQATAPSTGGVDAISTGIAAMRFSIDQPYTYLLSATFEPNSQGYSQLQALLWGNQYRAFNYLYYSGVQFVASGLLPPDEYLFVISGDSRARCGSLLSLPGCDLIDVRTSLRFDFQLFPRAEEAVVPEPATMILLGSGLVGVFAARRRQRNVG